MPRAAAIFYKQSHTDDKGWSSNLGNRRRSTTTSPLHRNSLRSVTQGLTQWSPFNRQWPLRAHKGRTILDQFKISHTNLATPLITRRCTKEHGIHDVASYVSRLPTQLRTPCQKKVEMLIKTGISSICIGKGYVRILCGLINLTWPLARTAGMIQIDTSLSIIIVWSNIKHDSAALNAYKD
jgi:hypothetical protein